MLKVLNAHPVLKFCLKTAFFFAVLLALAYLYGYYGVGRATFLYNEF